MDFGTVLGHLSDLVLFRLQNNTGSRAVNIGPINYCLGSHKLSSNLWLGKREKKRYQKSNHFASATAPAF